MKEPWWSRTGIEPTDLLIKSGALPLSYGPVTKDAGTMLESGLASNQENGLTIVSGLVELPNFREDAVWNRSA